MKRASVALLALAAATALAPHESRAQGKPDAEEVRKAASEFDEGSRAYRAERYEPAAIHFEAADEAVPSARALRMAIRSRDQASQPAQAATLAAQALARYPNDQKTRELADATVAAHASSLHRLAVSCSEPCVVALGARTVPGAPRKSWVIYVEPGEVRVSASFVGGAGSDEQALSARARGDNSLRFLPPVDAPGASAPPPSPAPAPLPAPGADVDPPPDAPADEPMWIEHPGVFAALCVATAGLGGVTIWSGIDTLQEPGVETVREECRGQGTDCREYQEGLAKELRTNILIGGTAGMAVVTLLFAVLVTDWGGGEDAPEAAVVLLPGGGFVGIGGHL